MPTYADLMHPHQSVQSPSDDHASPKLTWSASLLRLAGLVAGLAELPAAKPPNPLNFPIMFASGCENGTGGKEPTKPPFCVTARA